MKRKPIFPNLIIFGFIIFAFLACKADEEDQCDDWKYNEKWEKIVNSSGCSAEQKGEAYLALGGFDYFNLITNSDEPFAKALNLKDSNWNTKLNYFDAAANAVRSSYKKGSGIAKTIFLLGTFAGAYTYLEGNLDNGNGGNTSFDGEMADEEINFFLGTDIVDNTSDGTELNPTTDYQVVYLGNYYILDDDGDFWINTDANGITKGAQIVDAGLLANLADTDNWTAVYQIAELDKVEDPLSGIGDFNAVTTFATKLVSYLDDLEDSVLAIGIEADSTTVEQITDFKSDLDNGGTCTKFDDNPGLRLVNLMITKTRESVRVSSDYSNDNLFSISDMSGFGEDATFDAISGVETGVKLIFKSAGGYVPYWDDATDDVKDAMTNIALFGDTEIEADDGEVAFTEVVCAADLIGEDE